MADVASKQQTTALFFSTIVTRTRRHTELTKKLTNLMGNLCCAREHSVQFFVQPRLYSSLTAPNLQHTANQERNDQCGSQHHSRELLIMGIVVSETC